MLGREVAEDEVARLDISNLLDHAHPSLLDPAIGSEAVAPPLTARELRDWGPAEPLRPRGSRDGNRPSA